MYYMLLYDVVPDYLERRAAFRDSHLALARAAHARGELVMAGAFHDPVDGAALVFKTDNPAVPEEFAKHDPYVLNGLVSNWRVRRWAEVLTQE